MGKKKKLKMELEMLDCERRMLDFAVKNMEEKLKYSEIENGVLKERIEQLELESDKNKRCEKCKYFQNCASEKIRKGCDNHSRLKATRR